MIPHALVERVHANTFTGNFALSRANLLGHACGDRIGAKCASLLGCVFTMISAAVFALSASFSGLLVRLTLPAAQQWAFRGGEHPL